MRKHLLVTLLIIAVMCWAAPAIAQNDEVTFTVDSMISKIGSNGKEYVRFIGSFELVSESGIKYPDALPFMAFGKLVEEAKTYKTGDTVSVIAKARTFEGRNSYTILKFVTETASQ
jgi:hypothetical protein